MGSQTIRDYTDTDSFTLKTASGYEQWLTVRTGGDGELFRNLRREINHLDGHILSQFVMAGNDHFEKGMESLQPVAWPVTWIQGDACQDGDIYSSQIEVLSGPELTPVTMNGRLLGYAYETPDARFCRLAGLRPDDLSASREQQTRSVFEQMAFVLERCGMQFTDTVRTWLYLDRLLEWYDEFNTVRTRFFDEQGVFGKRVPASTGIGASNPQGAALVADLLAVVPKNDACRIEVVPSPLQCPAIDYKSSFSRAVELVFPSHRQLLISGTASIHPDGSSAHRDDPSAQIDLTMRVVEGILHSRGMGMSHLARGIAYFKDNKDVLLWNDWCLRHPEIPRFPLAVSHADVCRDDLLFEIEVDAVKTT